MATINVTAELRDSSYYKHSWSGITEADTGEAIQMPGLSPKTGQVDGTFGTGGTLVLEGSNDGTNWFQLSDFFSGAALTFTAAGIFTIAQNVEYVRPRVSAGTGVAVNVTLVSVRG